MTHCTPNVVSHPPTPPTSIQHSKTGGSWKLGGYTLAHTHYIYMIYNTYTYTYTYICICICICICVCVCVYVYMCICVYVYMCICICISICICIYMYNHTYMSIHYIYICIHTHIYTFTHMYVHVETALHAVFASHCLTCFDGMFDKSLNCFGLRLRTCDRFNLAKMAPAILPCGVGARDDQDQQVGLEQGRFAAL